MAKTQAYKGNGKHTWEIVHSAANAMVMENTTRLRVPGGWLYRACILTKDGDTLTSSVMSTTFVPLPAVLVQGKGDSSKGRHAL